MANDLIEGAIFDLTPNTQEKIKAHEKFSLAYLPPFIYYYLI